MSILEFAATVQTFYENTGYIHGISVFGWTDHVRNEEVLLRVNEQRNILHEIRKWKAN